MAISAGSDHVLALMDDGTVLSWGKNTWGELGNGVNGTPELQLCFKTPQKVLIDNVTAISAGHLTSYALKLDGTVWAWGYNGEGDEYGYLGCDVNESQSVPMQVNGLNNVTSIAASGIGCIALKDDGTVWRWGPNGDSSFGDDNTMERFAPAPLNGLSEIKALGERGNFAIKKDGTVYAWGSNTYGIDGEYITYGALGDTSGPGIRATPFQVDGLSNVTQITHGQEQTIYVKEDGTVWAWGSITFGNLGDGNIKTSRPAIIKFPSVQTKIDDVKKVSSYASHSVALKNDGTVWFWGEFIDDRLVDGDRGESIPIQKSGLDHMVDISTGTFTGIALKDDGSVWGWGRNDHGQLGNNKKATDRPVLIYQPSKVTTMPVATVTPTDVNVTSEISMISTNQVDTPIVSVPGFTYKTMAIVSSLLITTGLLSSLKRRKKV